MESLDEIKGRAEQAVIDSQPNDLIETELARPAGRAAVIAARVLAEWQAATPATVFMGRHDIRRADLTEGRRDELTVYFSRCRINIAMTE